VKINLFQKIASYILPVKIWKGRSTDNPMLGLFLYMGQWQLATDDAIYSDGSRYRPLVMAFRKIKNELPAIKNILVLGSGLGSAVSIAHKMGYHPFFTLVEKDSKVITLAQQLLNDEDRKNVAMINDDAQNFMQKHSERYDLIIIDIFSGRKVPAFVSTKNFIEKCRSCLNRNGIFIINYMLNDKEDNDNFYQLKEYFPGETDVIDIGINRVLIAKA